MRKLLTLDDFIVAGISGIGYGLGFKIPTILGYEEWQSAVISLIVGFALDKLANAVVFSKVVQSSTANRIMVFLAYILIGTAIQYAFISWKDISIDDYAIEGYAYLVVPTILGFAFSMALQWYRIRRIRKIYGDGSGGFVFDDLINREDFRNELNKQNQQIHGAFDTELAVKTKTGVFVGEKTKGAIFFCGIPYAKPPVGKLRWKAPEPLPESEEVFEARYLGASAIQVDYDGSPLKYFRQSEDCLYLNIAVGSKKTAKKKPVVVIFHHGDFSFGGSSDPILYGGELNKVYPDSVFVTFNYRLGILGFIDFSEIPGGENYPDAINLGLLDQIAALKWIHENISAFGGDPNQITLMGFESGALSITLLMAFEEVKGLFKKAFIFDGSPAAAYQTTEISRGVARKLLRETYTTTMEEILQIPAERLKEVTQKLAHNLSAPTCDGKSISIDAYGSYLNNFISGEFIIGVASNEKQIYKAAVGNEKFGDFMAKEIEYMLSFLDAKYPDVAEDLRNYIEEQKATLPEAEANANAWEQCYTLSIYKYAQELAESGNKVYLLYWDVEPLIKNLGSGTVDVLATFLGNREAAQIYGNVLNKDIAETLQNLFQKFKNGDAMKLFNNEIKGMGALEWKKFPNALIVSEKSFQCKPILDKLVNIKSLLKILE